jgi:hypothetical protein
MKDFLIDSNTVYEKGMQGYTALTIIEENLNRLDELLKEASNEINKHDELNRMYYQSLESDIQYLRDYQNKYQSFIGGTYNVDGDGGFVGEYKDTVDDPYYKQKEALLDKLGDLKLEDITVDNKLGITTNVQAFVGHTTTIKDKVNIRDILGFGNISDNIKKQYEESKALIEKYNEGVNTYNEADYPSILLSFAKKLWYNLTKKKEKTIDNYDDYLDAIIKSGDFNFETEGEKKLSIGLDFIPILGIEKMTLEGLLGEDLVSGRDLNGLERILAVAPAGIGAIAKVKNAIKLGELGGKVEGSISFGMNGGGQLDNIISKLKESKAEEDMVAKEAVTIDKGVSNPESTLQPKLEKYVQDSFEGVGKEAQDNFNKYLRENVWCDETLSNAEKIDIMKANFDKLTPEQKINFNVSNEVKVIKNPEKSNWGEWPDIEWPDFPGLNKDTAKSVYNEATGKIEIPSDLDRLGSPYGNNLGVIEDGYHCTQNERSICYIENEYARNSYKFDGIYYKDALDAIKDFDMSNPSESVDKINNIIDKLNVKYKINNPHIEEGDILFWNKDYNAFQNEPKLVELCKEKGINSTYGVMGEAEKWMMNGELITSGGAGQINIPIKVKALEDIGIFRNIGGW